MDTRDQQRLCFALIELVTLDDLNLARDIVDMNQVQQGKEEEWRSNQSDTMDNTGIEFTSSNEESCSPPHPYQSKVEGRLNNDNNDNNNNYYNNYTTTTTFGRRISL